MPARTRLAAAGIGGAAAAGLLAFGVAAPAGAAPAPDPAHDRAHTNAAHAVFVLANDPAGNDVAVYDRNPEGTLTAAGRYATGGRGGILTGSVVDHLASQGSLALDPVHPEHGEIGRAHV